MLKCYWQVTAGLILGQIDNKHTRRWEITGQEWEASENQMLLLLSAAHQALAYATTLQIACADGREPNWVHTEFCWL